MVCGAEYRQLKIQNQAGGLCKTVVSAVAGWRFSGEGEKNDDSLTQKGQSFFREAECFQLKENQVGKYEKVASFMKKSSK